MKYPDTPRPTKVQLEAMNKQVLTDGFLDDGKHRCCYEGEIIGRMRLAGCASMHQWLLRDAPRQETPELKVVSKPGRPAAPFPYVEFKTRDDYDVGPECRTYLDYFDVIEEQVGWGGLLPDAVRSWLKRMANGATYGSLGSEDQAILRRVRDVAQEFYHIDNPTVAKVQQAKRRDRQRTRN